MTRHDTTGSGRMTRHTAVSQEVDLIRFPPFWIDADDHATLVRAALDEGCPPEALLAEIIHDWRTAREAGDAEMAASVSERHGAGRKP